MKTRTAINKLSPSLFTIVYAKEKDHFVATLDYGVRTKSDKFIVLTDDIPKLSVSLHPVKVKETVEPVVSEVQL